MFFSFNVVAASSYSGASALQWPLWQDISNPHIGQVSLEEGKLTTMAELQGCG
jgi:hypothetical protein